MGSETCIRDRRWLIENDFRTIKHTVNLDVVYAKTADVAKKEVLFGLIAYNLVRALIVKGAEAVNLKPRDISFTRAVQEIKIAATRLSRATTPDEARHSIEAFYRAMSQIKHPTRKRVRIEPRVLVNTRRPMFPGIKGTRDDERQRLSGSSL